jgi:hypothetical protein
LPTTRTGAPFSKLVKFVPRAGLPRAVRYTQGTVFATWFQFSPLSQQQPTSYCYFTPAAHTTRRTVCEKMEHLVWWSWLLLLPSHTTVSLWSTVPSWFISTTRISAKLHWTLKVTFRCSRYCRHGCSPSYSVASGPCCLLATNKAAARKAIVEINIPSTPHTSQAPDLPRVKGSFPDPSEWNAFLTFACTDYCEF